ncbi:hypothetical protein Gotur_032765 [Gossypium turneri]
MGLGHNNSCSFCGHEVEDILHVLRDHSTANKNAFAGGVVRDQAEKWILGYNHYLGSCTPFEAELWGILDGLLILLNKGYK